ncbi:MAG: hypothetical protein E6J79_10865 [Deltaproteobacteria bacterium]|nr:MAG: hypothetical protein E6J79_10865 [Deltaproteobacteria bacterium]
MKVSDFIAFFPSDEGAPSPPAFAALPRVFADGLHAHAVRAEQLGGATLFRTVPPDGRVFRFFARDGSWVVVKGIMVDVRARRPQVDLGGLLDELMEEAEPDLNRYEGTFAAAAWDARARRGWAFNDQVSLLNLYYGEFDAGMYVASTALPLAVALGLAPSATGLQEFLARGCILAPASAFEGISRLDVGEHVRYEAGRGRIRQHWRPYKEPAPHRSLDEAAAAIASVIVDRVRRFDAVSGPMVFDLTGGYDSRLLASGAHFAGVNPTVTVNGPPDLHDVVVSKQVAAAAGWPMMYFDTTRLGDREIDAEMRREFCYRTNAEIVFSDIYNQQFSRPMLAERFNLHAGGVGGEFVRYYPWSQEFFGIGRRRKANVENVLRYRFLQGGFPPADLFERSWFPALRTRLASQIDAICSSAPGTLTNQQLDAVHVWKFSAGTSLYMSALFNWFPTCLPLLTAGFVESGIETPWRLRLSTALDRRLIRMLAPRASDVVTIYGGPASPVRLATVPLHLRQTVRQCGHLAAKLDTVLGSGRLFGRWFVPSRAPARNHHILTRELRDFLTPEKMRSRGLYAMPGLRRVLAGSDDAWAARRGLILRIATIEQLCRELRFEPGPDHLTAGS